MKSIMIILYIVILWILANVQLHEVTLESLNLLTLYVILF